MIRATIHMRIFFIRVFVRSTSFLSFVQVYTIACYGTVNEYTIERRSSI